MGTLDDAIREHLELKRRSGAGEDEVTRLENEAFGSARREAPVPAAEPVPPSEEPVSGEDVPPPPAAAEPPPSEPEPEPAPVADTWLEDDDEEPDAEPEVPAASPAPEAEPEGSGGSHTMGTAEHVAPDEEAEDLLEETPDFLQETPEHDRLWFEQKPPRDFDFE